MTESMEKTKTKLHDELFDLISIDESNEQAIIDILVAEKNQSIIKEVINTISDEDYEESMLMWAVWRLKKQVVIKLLELGADPDYQTTDDESVSTYWDLEKTTGEFEQRLAGEIAEILHKADVDLSDGGFNSWSLVKKAHKDGLKLLEKKLELLGYQYEEDMI